MLSSIVISTLYILISQQGTGTLGTYWIISTVCHQIMQLARPNAEPDGSLQTSYARAYTSYYDVSLPFSVVERLS